MSRCKKQMIAEGERLVPRTCPECGLGKCQRDYTTTPNPAGDWMLTYTGKAFYPMEPRATDVDISDIAHALAMLCRFGGHTQQFYSVAEHCVLMANAAQPELKLAALMHDASEAYLCDIIRPIKVHLPNYVAIEDKLMRVIADAFGFAWPLPPEIKVLDERMLGAERDQAVKFPAGKAWSQWKQIDSLPVTLQFWSPDRARYEFLMAFERYC